jgi:nucleoid DNA-binding protein
MADPSLRGRQQLREEVCAACGSTWFRKAEFSAYEPSQGSVLPPKRLAPWVIAWQAVFRMPLSILVCLCGAPVRPVLSGGAESRTGRAERNQLSKDFERRANLGEHIPVGQRRTYVDDLLPARLPDLSARVRKLEKAIGRTMAETDPARGTIVGRHWKPPFRKPTGARDWLAIELQKRGFAFRKAREIVTSIFDCMRESLRRGEHVETPLGTFEWAFRKRPGQTRIRFGRKQILFRNYKWVVFVPDSRLKDALPDAAPGSGQGRDKNNQKGEGGSMQNFSEDDWLHCSVCQGTSFSAQQFRQYRAGISSSQPGGHILQASANGFEAYVCLCGNFQLARP